MKHRHRAVTLALSAAILPAAAAPAQSLAEHYGFEPLEVIKIEKGAGPMATSDMDGDGTRDIIAANNRNSRIDVLLQKSGATPDDPPPPLKSVNDIPQHWRYRRVEVPVAEEVGAVIPYDFDRDGLMDLVYAGAPGRIVFMRQTAPGTFDVARKHTVRNLNPTRDALAIANVTGDASPELIGIVSGRIQIWPLDGTDIGSPTELSAGTGNIVALIVEDFDGDGTQDLVGVLPDDAAPVRAWFGTDVAGTSSLGPQMRFEMPPLREASAVRLNGQKAAMLGTIERPSRRAALYRIEEKPATTDAD
ncbi:MAG: VCBS repeat-containing protein, partial [Phycisphaerales bacterium]|nr:VCBS repeat-containing protein [Phycisphaerales bacterium]